MLTKTLCRSHANKAAFALGGVLIAGLAVAQHQPLPDKVRQLKQ